MKTRYLLVCGSREWGDGVAIRDRLADFIGTGASIIHGGAEGADALAGEACRELGLNSFVFKPDYEAFGKCAPHVRNDEMLKHADRVIAFWDGKSLGTQSVISKARKLDIPVEIITAAGQAEGKSGGSE